MAERQGRAMWPGVQGFLSLSYTCSHGISPGVATLTIPDQDVSGIAPVGTLVITDGVGTVALPRCRVVDVKFSGGAGSPRTITLLIADRRWMWKFGGISGNWNQVDPYPDPDSFPPDEFVASGGPYAPGTYRTADKLIADCLAAMNETNAIIDPPPVVPIAVTWDAEPPAAALQALCDTLGYRIVYRPALDQVAIVPAGVGIPLPQLPTIISGSDGIDPPERPNAFQLVGGDTIWNDYLELEPVTLELNGRVVKLDDASYKPSTGWGRATPPHFGIVHAEHGAEACELAQRHVWRTFRVKIRDVAAPYQLPVAERALAWLDLKFDPAWNEIPKYGKVTDRKQIVLNTQVYGVAKDERGQLQTEPPYVVGSVYYSASFARPANGGITLGAFGNTVCGAERLPIRPQIDSARGLVMFDRPLFRNLGQNAAGAPQTAPAAGAIGPPELYLYTSFRIRSLAGMTFARFEAAGVAPTTADPLCPPEYLRHPELVAVVAVIRNASKGFRIDDVFDNIESLKAAADYHLKAADAAYVGEVTSERTYAGILPLDPDGAIQQVTWSVGGSSPATTQASRNTEHSRFIPPYPERRRRERINNFHAKAVAAEGVASADGRNLLRANMFNRFTITGRE